VAKNMTSIPLIAGREGASYTPQPLSVQYFGLREPMLYLKFNKGCQTIQTLTAHNDRNNTNFTITTVSLLS
jgi:hypothetical protein